MSTEIDNQVPQSSAPTPRYVNRRFIAGAALVAIGVLALVATFTDSRVFGLSFLLLLGLIFLVWGTVARLAGLLIAGGVLGGLGVGVLVAEEAFASATGDQKGGIIVLGLALGFLLIPPLARLVTGAIHWWAVVVGGVLALIGAGLIIGGPALDVLNVVGRLWPLALIAVGVFLIWQISRRR